MKDDQFFEQFEEIYEKREQYNMTWAFKDAQEKLDNYKKEIVDDKIKKQCSLCKKMNKEYESYKSQNHTEIKKQRMISRMFANAHNLINIIEIILSVVLVLLISEISHGDMVAHSTELFSVMVVIVFAFIKVFIEHLFLRPRVEALGWQMYKRSVEALRNLSDDMNDQLVYELEAV